MYVLTVAAAATAAVVNLSVMCSAHSEGDPLGGWSTGAEWRADVRYAAVVVKVHINSCDFVMSLYYDP